MEQNLVTFVTSVIILLLVAACSAAVFKRIRFPYTIGLVVVGILLGALCSRFEALAPMRKLHLTPDFILYIIIPTLVFQAAVNIDSRLLMKNLSPVLVLAAPGLLISTLIVGGLIAVLTPLPIGPAMLFGALISATDPVAVISLFKEIGAPKRLTLLVDGESLFNDATAIVAFNIIFGIIAAGVWSAYVLLHGAIDFAVVFIGGVGVGVIIGYIMIKTISFTNKDPLIEIAFSTVVAYAAFIAANYYLKVSGVMAVVGAGIVVSWYGSVRLTPRAKQYLRDFWEYAAFVANSFIFLLLGFSEIYLIKNIFHSPELLIFIAAAVAAVTIARAVVIYGLIPLVNRLPGIEQINQHNQTIIFWGGLRGAVPMALALSLAANFEHRALILELTLGVVLFTILVQGTTVSHLIHIFKMDRPTLIDKLTRLDAIRAAKHEALERISMLKTTGYFHKGHIFRLTENYKNRVSSIENALAKIRSKPSFPSIVIPQMMWTQAINVEKQTYQTLLEHGFISESVFRELELISDLQKDHLWHGEVPPRLKATKPGSQRIHDYMFSIIELLVPWSRIVQHHRVHAINARFEENIAVIEASSKAINALDEIGSLCGAKAPVIEKCRQLYKARQSGAIQELDSIAAKYPKYMDSVSDHTLYRAALSAELDTIKRLAANGEIPEKISDALGKNIDTNLHTLSRHRMHSLENRLKNDPEQILNNEFEKKKHNGIIE